MGTPFLSYLYSNASEQSAPKFYNHIQQEKMRKNVWKNFLTGGTCNGYDASIFKLQPSECYSSLKELEKDIKPIAERYQREERHSIFKFLTS